MKSWTFGRECCQVAKAVSFSVTVKIIPIELQPYEQSCLCVIRRAWLLNYEVIFICSKPASTYGFKTLEEFFFLNVFASLGII